MKLTKQPIYLILCFIIFVSCSPQKRLANLIQKHPELRSVKEIEYKDTIIIFDTIYIPEQTKTIDLTIEDIHKLDSAASGTDNANTESRNMDKQTVIETDYAGAALTAKGNGKFQLTAYSKPNTIYIKDTITKYRHFKIPVFYTDVKYVEKEVYKMHWWEQILFFFGLISMVMLITFIVTKIFNR